MADALHAQSIDSEVVERRPFPIQKQLGKGSKFAEQISSCARIVCCCAFWGPGLDFLQLCLLLAQPH